MLWISGDTVLYDGVRQVADRVQVDTALLHLGGVQFPVTGPVRYTMTAQEAVELCRLVRPRTPGDSVLTTGRSGLSWPRQAAGRCRGSPGRRCSRTR